jgi:serine/threonine-protein kinase
MSPEMASGEATVVTTAADIYGLGSILYTLLTGQPPFRRDTFAETLHAVLWDHPTPPSALNRKVDRELEQVCRKCLHKDPSRRYGSADALANDLGRWLRGEPTIAGRPTVGKHVHFWLRRHPIRVAAVALAALAFWLATVAGSVGGLHAANRREARRLAREVQTQLRMIEYEVEDVARDPELRARWTESSEGSSGRRRALSTFLSRVSRTYTDRFGMTGGNPLINVLLMDDRGVILADTHDGGRSIGEAFPLRDYFRALMAPAGPRSRNAVAVSRAFRSVVDGRYKIAVSARVWDGDRCLGLLVANVSLGPRLVLVDMTDEPEGAAVVSPMDWTYAGPGAPAPGERFPYLATFHRSYARAGASPIWPDPARFPRLADFERTPGLIAAAVAFRDGGVTDYRRVGGTPLIVLLQQPYPWPARWFFDVRFARQAAAGTAVLALTSLAVALSRVRRRSIGQGHHRADRHHASGKETRGSPVPHRTAFSEGPREGRADSP